MADRYPYEPPGYFAEQIWSPTSESILVWDEAFHNLLLNDRLRMTAYRQAIFETVRAGDHVVDLGVGTGVLSQWALEAGAARVTGIEMREDMMSRAVVRLQSAGYGAKFVPVIGVSLDLDLDEQADALISEIIGNMADNENFQPILWDATKRFLKPGGRQIPIAVTSFLAPVSATSAHGDLCAGRIHDLSAHHLERATRSSPFDGYYDCVLPENLYLDDPKALRHFAAPWEGPATYDQQLRFAIRRPGTFTGFKACFSARLTARTNLDICSGDIAAGKTSDSWKHAYLPIEEPIPVVAGDDVELRFSRNRPKRREGFFDQAYRWRGTVSRRGVELGRFEQATG